MISGPINDRPRRPDGESAQPSAGCFVGHAAVGDRSVPVGGPASRAEPSKAVAGRKGTPYQAVHVRRRGGAIRLACGCGHFVLSFHSLYVIPHGRFRCPICGRQVRLSDLEALRGIDRISSGGEARACLSDPAPCLGSSGWQAPD